MGRASEGPSLGMGEERINLVLSLRSFEVTKGHLNGDAE